MATLTGENLLNSIIESSGVELNQLIRSTLTAKLQQMIDNDTYSKLAASIALNGFSTGFRDAMDINQLSDTIETNSGLIEAAEEGEVDEIDFSSTENEYEVVSIKLSSSQWSAAETHDITLTLYPDKTYEAIDCWGTSAPRYQEYEFTGTYDYTGSFGDFEIIGDTDIVDEIVPTHLENLHFLIEFGDDHYADGMMWNDMVGVNAYLMTETLGCRVVPNGLTTPISYILTYSADECVAYY